VSLIPPLQSAIGGAHVITRTKLIEVALPLEKINVASAREKSIRHGHPSTLHLWWARRPLAAARAVIFSQMVDDPSEYTDELLADAATRQKAERELVTRRTSWLEKRAHQAEAAAAGDVQDPDPGPEPTLDGCAADLERERLFALIEQLVTWENLTNETLLEQARAELRRSWRRTCADNREHPRAMELFDPDRLPAFHDPFAGGGALPLEAQRLGLVAYASELNPVAVLINKAMIEIPPTFAGQPPVNPAARNSRTLLAKEWRGAHGLAADVRHYGQWMRDEAEKRIGDHYPKVEVTAEMVSERPDLKTYVGRSLTVIAWLWARTVKSPNPAFASVDVPLASTFMLSTKTGREAYIEPVIQGGSYQFTVKVGKPKDGEAAKNGTKVSRANFVCLMSGAPIEGDYLKAEAKAGRMGARLMAIVAEGERGRVYLAPTAEHEVAARKATPEWSPDVMISGSTQYLGVKPYGMERFDQLFTERQLVALTTFCDLVQQARERVKRDAQAAGLPDDANLLDAGGIGPTAYAEAVGVYLAFAVDKGANYWSSVCAWHITRDGIVSTFGRQAIPMVFDYAEANPLSGSSGNILLGIEQAAEMIEALGVGQRGFGSQADAATQAISANKVVSTDPPYFDNVPYADLSDFFYVWLRQSQRPVFPSLFATVAVPKAEELVAFAYRHNNKAAAEAFFLSGMTQAMRRLAEQSHPAFPVTIYYAFRQAETDDEAGTASTGWDTFLEAVISAGFGISGTWPMRTEYTGNLKTKRNALASSIILVCRPRAAQAPTATRREFVTALKAALPAALAHLQRGNIAPVDLAQAAIGSGMAVYTRYARVLNADGKPLTVREALRLINKTLDEALAEQEGDFDADSRWALTWFDQKGFAEGEYGVAEQLSKSKNTSVAGMAEAGILQSMHGKVRLLKPAELDPEWDPATDSRRPAWQAVHQLVQAADRGETALAELIAKLGPEAEIARELAYRLYVLSERTKRAEEALWYNGLVQSWPEAIRLVRRRGVGLAEQQQMFDTE
jgi:putative DNA methylase